MTIATAHGSNLLSFRRPIPCLPQLKVTVNGTVQWAASLGGSADDQGEAVAVHGDSVYVGGWWESSTMQVRALTHCMSRSASKPLT